MPLQLFSQAFEDGQRIPRQYTGEGKDVSPPVRWEGLPEGTKQLALICDDPDAPTPEPWVHWVIYSIPVETTSLPEGIPNKAELDEPPGALQGPNSWSDEVTIGYRGPMPPEGHGIHRYHFRLLALDTAFDFQPGLEKRTLLSAVTSHVIEQTELIGLYSR